MKITIGGSMVFAKQMLEIKKQLEEKGYIVFVTNAIEHYTTSSEIKENFEKELKISLEHDVIKTFFDKIAESDALLIINYPKNNIKGYLGTSVLMEIGLAYHLNKKIYLLYNVDKSQSYALEIGIIKPEILDGDVFKIE